MRKVVLSAVFVVFCGTALFAQNFANGFYFAQDANWSNNQKNQVAIEVRGGKMSSVNFNVISLASGARDLKTISRAPDAAAAVKNWAGQVAAVENHIVSSQNLSNARVQGGPSNASSLFDLANRAVGGRSPQAVPKGTYSKDGWFYAEDQKADEWHTRNTVLITVLNGTIVDVLWNGILVGMPPSINPSKLITSRARGYPMVDSKWPWDEQANKIAAEMLKLQNPAMFKIKPDGHADGISGVSIHISDFVNVAKQALTAAQ